jgi:hypothetical protein
LWPEPTQPLWIVPQALRSASPFHPHPMFFLGNEYPQALVDKASSKVAENDPLERPATENQAF